MKQWYEALFENYAKKYDKECFVQGTLGECDFIEKEITHDKSLKIIDIGCGTGRHSIELTRRGYNVTGIDLSESQLKRAREKAKDEGVEIDFQKHDARNLPFEDEFDRIVKSKIEVESAVREILGYLDKFPEVMEKRSWQEKKLWIKTFVPLIEVDPKGKKILYYFYKLPESNLNPTLPTSYYNMRE